jgi:hypothetical protein
MRPSTCTLSEQLQLLAALPPSDQQARTIIPAIAKGVVLDDPHSFHEALPCQLAVECLKDAVAGGLQQVCPCLRLTQVILRDDGSLCGLPEDMWPDVDAPAVAAEGNLQSSSYTSLARFALAVPAGSFQ